MKRIVVLIFVLASTLKIQAGNPDLFYYLADTGDTLYSINRITGVQQNIGFAVSDNIEAIAFYPIPGANQLFAIDDGNIGTLNLTGQNPGQFTFIANVDVTGRARGSEGNQLLGDIDGLMLDGQSFILWGSTRRISSDLLFQIDPTTGLLIRDAFGTGIDYLKIEGNGVQLDLDDIAINPKNGRMYVTTNNGGVDDVILEINKYTGETTVISTLDENDIEGFSFSNNGQLYGSDGDGNAFYEIDLATGATTLISATNGGDPEGLAALVADANTVTGTVFGDTDMNGTLNGGETGIANVRVELFTDNNNDGKVDRSDTRVQSVLTDASGNYTFYYASTANLVVSTKFSTFPSNFGLTTDNVEEADFADNVNFGEVDANNNFGLATGPDCDGDGIPNFVEGGLDSDGDAVRDSCDLDSDNDGIRDNIEGIEDYDNDGIADYKDRDSDNDGIPDALEANAGVAPIGYSSTNGNVSGSDLDGNGIVDSRETSSGSGVMVSVNPDSDNDGILDVFDLDADNDGILDIIEAGGTDVNGDGQSDLTVDGNNNGYQDNFETTPLTIPNTDNAYETTNSLTLRPNYLDIDSDADGIDDTREGLSTAGYRFPTLTVDSDNDGIIDFWDISTFNTPIVPVNTDGDALPDYLDLNSDDDNFSDFIEGNDANNDGVADETNLGVDADNNGLDDRFDAACSGASVICSSSVAHQDSDADGEDDFRDITGQPISPTADADGDGIPNGSDVDDDNDGILDVDESCPSVAAGPATAVPTKVSVGGNNNLLSNGAKTADAGLVFNAVGDHVVLDLGATIPAGGQLTLSFWKNNNNSRSFRIAQVPSSSAALGGGVNPIFITQADIVANPGVTDIIYTLSTPTQFIQIEMSSKTGGGRSELVEFLRNAYTTVGVCSDVDQDGIPNSLDLDSDNDGIPDLVEAGGVDSDGDGRIDGAFADGDGDGLHNTYDPDFATGDAITNADSDGDGIKNAQDLDADNDGIPDVVEAGGTDVNGDGRADNYDDVDNDGFNDIVDGDVGNDGAAENSGDALVLTGTDTNSDGVPNSYPNADPDGDDIPNYIDLDADDDGIPDVVEARGTDENGDGQADDYVDTDNDGFNDVVDGDPTNALALANDANGANTTNALLATGADTNDDGEPNSRPNGDFDNDNVYNFLDLDSDDDGILDVSEAGGVDANRDGQQDGAADADNDGFNDAVDGDTDNSLLVGTDTDGGQQANALTLTDSDANGDGEPDDYPNDDFDNDGNLNYLDIDADNDGIVDNTEGQSTASYVAPANADDDGDGIDNAYDRDDTNFGGVNSSFVLNDADATANPNTPDYLDLDADNDGDLDVIEGHDSNNDGSADAGSIADTGFPGGTTDADGDGLLDGYDNNDAANDPTNGGFRGEDYPGFDNPFTPEKDWREVADADNDGIADIDDIDDDNDGILDIAESNCNPNSNPVMFKTGGGSVNAPLTNVSIMLDNGTTDMDVTEVGSGEFSGNNNGTIRMSSNVGTKTTATITFDTPVSLVFSSHQTSIGGNFDLNDRWRVYAPNQFFSVTDPSNHLTDSRTGQILREATFQDTVEFFKNTGGTGENLDWKITTTAATEFFIDFSAPNNTNIGQIRMSAEGCVVKDSDNDGIADQFDIDSDNDGIPDILEAGGTDANNDGRVDDPTDTDMDGWADTFDPNNGGMALEDGDKDGDGVRNRLDLDADNDGIADIIEAGGADANGDGRADVTTDADNDGWSNTFDSDNGGIALPIVDTDGDENENYLDIDSDNDGIIDNIEGQLTNNVGATLGFRPPLGADTDMDGWDNRYDSDNGGTVITLSNNDGAGDGPDYIDQNSDTDSQPDWLEGFDDDEDGDALNDFITRAIAYETAAGNPGKYPSSDDVLPNPPGTGNGIPDFLDDTDGDGIPNFLDPDNGTFYFDTDKDGLVDLFDDNNFGFANNIVTSLSDIDNDNEPDFRDEDNDVTLPIELLNFTVIKEGKRARLDWTTLTEINNNYFTIERTLDGVNFDIITTVVGAGNSTKELSYFTYDENPSVGYNYYRLRQTDYDGKTEAFELKSVYFENDESKALKVYPNPTAGDYAYLELNGYLPGIYTIKISANSGQEIMSREIEITNGEEFKKVELIEGLNLSSGYYHVNLVNKNNSVHSYLIVQ